LGLVFAEKSEQVGIKLQGSSYTQKVLKKVFTYLPLAKANHVDWNLRFA